MYLKFNLVTDATLPFIQLSTNKVLCMTGKLVSTFSILAIVFVMYGCCKAMCIDKTLFLNFRKIRAVNTDSVSFISYTAGTGFSQKIDSSFINKPVALNDTSYSSLFRELHSDYDWKIINHSLNMEYRINNFVTEKIKCCSDKGYVVRSFMINNVKQTGDYLDLQ
jgi:hypothetical protein